MIISETILIILMVASLIMLIIIMIDKSKKISKEACLHKNTFIFVDSVTTTCETTTITCMDCKKRLNTETDCR